MSFGAEMTKSELQKQIRDGIASAADWFELRL